MEYWSNGLGRAPSLQHSSTPSLQFFMEFTTLGKTGLKVSVAGLGCGGPSRLGLRGGAGAEGHAVGLVKQALDLGINFLDTAQN